MWIDVMKEKIKSMKDNDICELISLLEGTKLIDCKWIFKIKRDSNGNVKIYKARHVTKDFTQRKCIDYKKAFSLISTKGSFRIIMVLVIHFDLELHQMDIKATVFNGNIKRRFIWHHKKTLCQEIQRNGFQIKEIYL